jgi:hypothetical protein
VGEVIFMGMGQAKKEWRRYRKAEIFIPARRRWNGRTVVNMTVIRRQVEILLGRRIKPA